MPVSASYRGSLAPPEATGEARRLCRKLNGISLSFAQRLVQAIAGIVHFVQYFFCGDVHFAECEHFSAQVFE